MTPVMTGVIHYCMSYAGSELDPHFLPCFVLSTPRPESNFLGGFDFIVGLKGLNVVHYEGMSG